MNTIITAVRTFIDDENGVTAIEYGLIAALIAGVLGLCMTYVKDGLSAAFLSIKTSLTS
ncbi:MAG: Flp family type IVb pilin [Pseudomonadota bacterium]